MALSADMLASWRHPRRVMARLLAAGRREDRALMFLMLGCALAFLSQWPRLMRASLDDPSTPLEARLGGALVAWLFIAPLALYVIAALSHVAARMLGGRGSWYGARLALFWALLAAMPMWLLNGLLAGLAGGGPLHDIAGAIALAGFVIIWLASLYQAEFGGEAR